MTVSVKICGITSEAIACSAIDAGADMLGFIFFTKSPRHLPLEDARALMAAIRTFSRTPLVSVLVDPDDGLLERITAEVKPDLIQLHGRETPERVREIHARFATPLIKALSVSAAEDLHRAADYEPHADYLMFDAKPPEGSSLPGGVGARFDWSLMHGYSGQKPWFLAGGLDPDNVRQALSLSKAPWVDVSSGVERAPGLKDPLLIKQFISNAKQT